HLHLRDLDARGLGWRGLRVQLRAQLLELGAERRNFALEIRDRILGEGRRRGENEQRARHNGTQSTPSTQRGIHHDLFATTSSFPTANTPWISRALKPATVLSDSLSTTPSSVVRPFFTMM